MKRQYLTSLFALTIMWSSSFVFMHLLSPRLGALPSSVFRVMLGGGMLVSYAVFRRIPLQLKSLWKTYLLFGFFNSLFPFICFAYAALHLPISYLAVFNATTPLFGASFAPFLLRDKLTLHRFLGVLLGILGVALVVHVDVLALTKIWWVVPVCLLGPMSYSLCGIYLKKHYTIADPVVFAGASQLVSGIVFLPFVPLLLPERVDVSSQLVVWMVSYAAICSAFAFVLYFKLIHQIGPIRTSTVTFLIPAFAIFWGVTLFDEVVTRAMVMGCLLVVAGTVLVLKPTKTLGGVVG